jgi:endonuclease/exonuclease/phosphatase family metal-dependent hydrolase
MKKVILGLGLGLWSWIGLGALPLAEPISGQPTLQVPKKVSLLGSLPRDWLTWNLQWFPGQVPYAKVESRKLHEEAVRSTIGKIAPQVALLQEVVDAKALGRVIPFYRWQAVSNFQRAKDEEVKLPPQNVAIVSRVPWKDVWEVDFHGLPITPDRPVRGFLGALFVDKNGNRLTAYVVHLKSNRGGRDASSVRRERAIDYLRWDWGRRGLDPQKEVMLLAGDFNCSLRNPDFTENTVRKLIQEGWKAAEEKMAWPAVATVKPDPAGRYAVVDFDHILLSPGWVKKYGGGEMEVGVWRKGEVPSDHFPLEMRLK